MHAQVRTVAFERWTPPRIAAERRYTGADSVQVRVGSHAGKGALIGAAVGAGLGIITGFALGGADSCSDCGDTTSPVAMAGLVGLVGAGAGAVIGVLFGLSSPKYEWRQADGT